MDTINFASVLSFLNIIMLVTLLSVYFKNYKMIKSRFCIGLMLFAGLLLLHSLTAFYFEVTMVEHYSNTVAQISLVLNVLQTLGVAALLYVTIKP